MAKVKFWDGSQWVIAGEPNQVTSVNSQTGEVNLTASDVGAATTDVATTSANGLMSSTDKIKLENNPIHYVTNLAEFKAVVEDTSVWTKHVYLGGTYQRLDITENTTITPYGDTVMHSSLNFRFTTGNKTLTFNGAWAYIYCYDSDRIAFINQSSQNIATIEFTNTTFLHTGALRFFVGSYILTGSGIRINYDSVAESEVTSLTGFDTVCSRVAWGSPGIGLVDENYKGLMSPADKAKLDGMQDRKTARFVIGTSTAGWTAADCDYLCDGTADQTEINAAITALPATGGEIVILDGTYNITAKINVTKDNVSIRGNGNATILNRMYDSSVEEGVITLTGRSGCKIANLQIDGNNTSYTSGNNYGIYLSGSSNSTITGNTCNNNQSGIYLDSPSSNNTITGNTCHNNDYGIYLRDLSNSTITGNTCIRGTGLTTDYTASQHTIRVRSTYNSYNLISNNNCMGKAVTVDGGTGNTVIDNKWSDSSGRILENYSEKLVTLSGTSTAINLSLGNVFTHTLSGNTTYTISNAVSGQAHSFTLIITQSATVRTLTFPASVKWQGGEIPDLSTAEMTYVLTFMTFDGGTTWLGMFGGEFDTRETHDIPIIVGDLSSYRPPFTLAVSIDGGSYADVAEDTAPPATYTIKAKSTVQFKMYRTFTPPMRPDPVPVYLSDELNDEILLTYGFNSDLEVTTDVINIAQGSSFLVRN